MPDFSRLMNLPLGKFAHQPGSRHLAIAHDGLRRDFENFGSLFHPEAAKELQLHNLGFAWVDAFEQLQCVIDSNQPLIF